MEKLYAEGVKDIELKYFRVSEFRKNGQHAPSHDVTVILKFEVRNYRPDRIRLTRAYG